MAKAKHKPRSLRRFLKKGETVVIRGIRGKAVKRPRPGRDYIVEVRRNRKIVDYVNPVKKGVPQARPFTTSMLSRLKNARIQRIKSAPKSGNTYNLTKKKFIKDQITKKMIGEIRKNKGKAFNFRIRHKNQNFMTHSIYFSGKMSEDSLRNLIVSDLLYTLSREHFRISPKPENIIDKKKTKRIDTAQLTLQFSEIERGKYNGKRKKSTKKATRSRSNEGVRNGKSRKTKGRKR